MHRPRTQRDWDTCLLRTLATIGHDGTMRGLLRGAASPCGATPQDSVLGWVSPDDHGRA